MEDTWENLLQSLTCHHNVRIIPSHEKPLVLIDCGGGGFVTKSCPTIENPINCSLSDFSVHGISQARVLEWVAISFFRGSSPPRDQTQVSWIAGGFFTNWATREAQKTVAIIQSEVSQKDKDYYSILTHIYGIKMLMITLYAEQKKRHRCIEQSFRLCGRRQGWDVSREQHRNMCII